MKGSELQLGDFVMVFDELATVVRIDEHNEYGYYAKVEVQFADNSTLQFPRFRELPSHIQPVQSGDLSKQRLLCPKAAACDNKDCRHKEPHFYGEACTHDDSCDCKCRPYQGSKGAYNEFIQSLNR